MADIYSEHDVHNVEVQVSIMDMFFSSRGMLNFQFEHILVEKKHILCQCCFIIITTSSYQ